VDDVVEAHSMEEKLGIALERRYERLSEVGHERRQRVAYFRL